MTHQLGSDQAKAESGRVKELEARLQSVMKERATIETAIEDAKKHEQSLHRRAAEIYSAEGALRKQLGDARAMRDAAGE
jgi:chaperonin cofactor prefoldin